MLPSGAGLVLERGTICRGQKWVRAWPRGWVDLAVMELKGSACLPAHSARHARVGGSYGRRMPPIADWIGPAQPGFVAFAAVVGGLLGRFVAIVLRYDADKTMRIAVDGGQLGAAIALVAYVFANLVEASF